MLRTITRWDVTFAFFTRSSSHLKQKGNAFSFLSVHSRPAMDDTILGLILQCLTRIFVAQITRFLKIR